MAYRVACTRLKSIEKQHLYFYELNLFLSIYPSALPNVNLAHRCPINGHCFTNLGFVPAIGRLLGPPAGFEASGDVRPSLVLREGFVDGEVAVARGCLQLAIIP